MMIPTRLLLLIGLAPSLACGQLHLLTGAPTLDGYFQQFGSAILRVEGDGSVKLVAQLVPDSVGTGWIDISYDWRKAVFGILAPDNGILVADLDKAAPVKKCKPPVTLGKSLIYSWLADSPLNGPSFDWKSSGSDPAQAVVEGMVLDPAVSCEESFQLRDPMDVRYVVTSGMAGIADVALVSRPRENVRLDGDRAVVETRITKPIPMDCEFPASMIRGLAGSLLADITVNDARELTLTVYDMQANYRVLVFRKSDKTWHTVPIVSERIPYVRGFGKYLVVTETQLRNERNPRSAGAQSWKRGARTTGPALAERDASSREVFPGRLHVYNIDTEEVFPIITRQGDTEVLLIEAGVVYYRVMDRLYSASLGDLGVGKATLLATDDAILDAHWAWIKR
jgi:hypothetical protein